MNINNNNCLFHKNKKEYNNIYRHIPYNNKNE